METQEAMESFTCTNRVKWQNYLKCKHNFYFPDVKIQIICVLGVNVHEW